eukprot:4697179-Prorocentrum_lima.AAC.1
MSDGVVPPGLHRNPPPPPAEAPGGPRVRWLPMAGRPQLRPGPVGTTPFPHGPERAPRRGTWAQSRPDSCSVFRCEPR